MSSKITAVFTSHDNAVEAARRVKDEGLRTSDISIVTNEQNTTTSNDQISRGTVSGGVLGGTAGLLLGLGTIAIPGLGMIAAAGPIVGLLGGAVTGGIVGALVDLGIPQKKSQEYEKDIKEGNTVWAMDVEEENKETIKNILRECGAYKVEEH
ncbi:MAG: hypothetical protein BWY15_00386 [Firmicutes bacterium ADurb.Bin193]|nr:MAG: hypothetical protein BWY15_00386 [Firmicutes bacterium ADurb.Bin193]